VLFKVGGSMGGGPVSPKQVGFWKDAKEDVPFSFAPPPKTTVPASKNRCFLRSEVRWEVGLYLRSRWDLEKGAGGQNRLKSS